MYIHIYVQCMSTQIHACIHANMHCVWEQPNNAATEKIDFSCKPLEIFWSGRRDKEKDKARWDVVCVKPCNDMQWQCLQPQEKKRSRSREKREKKRSRRPLQLPALGAVDCLEEVLDRFAQEEELYFGGFMWWQLCIIKFLCFTGQERRTKRKKRRKKRRPQLPKTIPVVLLDWMIPLNFNNCFTPAQNRSKAPFIILDRESPLY